MKVKSWEASGFGIFKDLVRFNFDSTPKLYLVSGRNGQGKSTFFVDLPMYLLTGAPYSDKPASDIMNDRSDVCAVQGFFDEGKLLRLRQKQGISLGIDDKPCGQKDFDSAVKITREMMLNSVVFGQGFKGFVFFKDSEKRKFITEIGLSFVDKYVQSAEQTLKELQSKSDEVESGLRDNVQRLTDMGQELIRLRVGEKQLLSEIQDMKKNQDRIKSIEQDMADCDMAICERSKSYNKEAKSWEEFSKKKSDVESAMGVKKYAISDFEEKLRKIDASIKFLENSSTCDKCTSYLPEKKRQQVIHKLTREKQEVLMEINANSKEHLELENRLKELQGAVRSTRGIMEKLQEDIARLKQDKVDCEVELASLKSQKGQANPYTELIAAKQAQEELLNDQKQELESHVSAYSMKLKAAKVLLEELRKLKGSMFNDILGSLSPLSDSYLRFMTGNKYGMEITATVRVGEKNIRDRFEVAILHDGRKVAFERLSGGERNLVALACNTALIQSLSAYMAADFNFIVLDESLVNLDGVARSKVVELLHRVCLDSGKHVVAIVQPELTAEELGELSDEVVKVRVQNGKVERYE